MFTVEFASRQVVWDTY